MEDPMVAIDLTDKIQVIKHIAASGLLTWIKAFSVDSVNVVTPLRVHIINPSTVTIYDCQEFLNELFYTHNYE